MSGTIIASIALIISLYTLITKHRPYVWVAEGMGFVHADPWAELVVRNGGEIPANEVTLRISWHPRDHSAVRRTWNLGTIYPAQPVNVSLSGTFTCKPKAGESKDLSPFARGAEFEEFTLEICYTGFGLPRWVRRVMPFRHTGSQKVRINDRNLTPMEIG